MKKILLILLVTALAVSVLGCAEKKTAANNNDVFVSECFEGLEHMSLLGYTKALSGEDMQPVIDILQSLTLREVAEQEVVQQNADAVLLILEYEDGRIETVQLSDTIVWSTEVGAVKYCTADTFFEEFKSHFGEMAK